jgi:geranylgeranylglycerol-phosphate geranylgeranyltransferase
MNTLLPYLKIARINNVLMTGAGVALGFWLGRSTLPIPGLFLLIIAGIFAASFGNVINDIHDIATDRISHNTRPLPRNELSVNNAWIFSTYLVIVAIESSVFVSMTQLAATIIPLLLLTIYTFFLKKTPLAGNIVISLLVGYALLYGALSAPAFDRLLIPACLAFLLNFAREIIKDVQDEPGDRAAGIATTAALPSGVIRTTVFAASGACLLLLFVPWALHHFGRVYAGVCLLLVLPIQVIWLSIFIKKNWRQKLPLLSLLIKLEMAAGLAALAADRLFLN